MNSDASTMSTSAANSRFESLGESPSAYAWYVAIVFAIFFVFSFVDRQIIGILVPDMKGDLGLSDVQLSYIGGLSFVIFYTVFGIPMGRLADTYNRKWLIIFGVVAWTLATAACSLADEYWELLILRMGVGIGEAALAPCAYSILADIFPRHRLTLAISICTMGGAFGFGFAFLGGAAVLGWANGLVGDPGFINVPFFGDLTPWRIVFLAVGLPGLAFTAFLFTIREPTRRGQSNTVPPLSEVVKFMRRHWLALTAIYVGMGFLNVGSYGAAFWDITFFHRSYGWPPEQSGIFYGITATLGQFTGALIAGIVTDRLSRTASVDPKMKILMLIAFASIWLRLLYPLMPNSTMALTLILPLHVLTGAPFGIAAAALQILAPARMRGQITAVYFFAQSIIGLGLGPTLVAFLTEYMFQDLSMLRYSLLISGGAALALSTGIFYIGRKPYLVCLAESENMKDVN